MFDILGGLLDFLFFTMIPLLFTFGIFAFALMGIGSLKDVSKGYSHLQITGGFFILSGICMCFGIGYDCAKATCTEEWTCWFIGMMWVAICSVGVGICLAFKVPTIVMACVVWGFILIGPGELPAYEEFEDTEEVQLVDVEPEKEVPKQAPKEEKSDRSADKKVKEPVKEPVKIPYHPGDHTYDEDFEADI